MTDKTTKTGVATRDFDDAGTGQHFTKGKSYELEAGAHANYEHAGLIGDPAADAPAPAAATALDLTDEHAI